MTIATRRRLAKYLLAGSTLWALIPFGCGGQTILRTIAAPILLDDTYNFLDALIRAVAPLVLPG